MNILVVEDDFMQCKAIEEIIRTNFNASYIQLSYNYQDAIDKITNNSFDIFILDIDLNEGNEKNGIAVAKYIRTFPFYAITPILFLTSYIDKMEIAINQTHCYSYLMKPYGINDLKESISSLIKTSLMPKHYMEFKDLCGIYYHIDPSHIVYAEIQGHILYIYTTQNEFKTKEYSFQNFCALLANDLQRCHKSYAVNPHIISGYNLHTREIYLPYGFPTIPIGRQYLKIFHERIKK